MQLLLVSFENYMLCFLDTLWTRDVTSGTVLMLLPGLKGLGAHSFSAAHPCNPFFSFRLPAFHCLIRAKSKSLIHSNHSYLNTAGSHHIISSNIVLSW